MRRMMHIFTGLILICMPAALAGCTDAKFAQITALCTPARVTCFSGGKVILDDMSSGKVSHQEGGGAVFKSQTTGRLVETNADCVVDHMTSTPAGWVPVLP